MVQIVKSNCPACGAPLSIPADLDRVNCANCGSGVIIEHGEGYYTLKSAEKIAQAIEQTNNATRDAIRENTNATKSELQRLHFSQELSSAKLQLSNTQVEIRLLEQSRKTRKSAAQLLALRQSEFQTMEQIRSLQQKASMPVGEDLKEDLRLAEWEKSWIITETQVLKEINKPNMKQIRKGLDARSMELSNTIAQTRIAYLKSICPSFQQQDPSPSDVQGINALLALIVSDEKKLREQRGTPEEKVIRQALAQREWRLVNLRRNNTQERSKSIDNRSPQHSGMTGGLLAGIAALFAGGAILANKDKGTSSESSAATNAADAPSSTVPASIRYKGSFGSIVKGVLLSFLTFLGCAIVGFVFIGFTSSENGASNFGMSILFLCLAAGIALGTRVFLRRSAPKINIRLFGKMKDIVIIPKKGSSYGIISLGTVKAVIAIATCIFVYFFFLFLGSLNVNQETWAVSIVLIGLVSGPVLAWMAAKRVSISFPVETL